MWFLFIIISVIFSSFMQVLTKKYIVKLDPFIVTIYKNFILFGLSFLLLFKKNTMNNIFKINKKDLLMLIIIGIITFLAYLFYYLSLKEQKVNKIIAIEKLNIIGVAILSFIVLKEELTLKQIIGLIIILIGIFLSM